MSMYSDHTETVRARLDGKEGPEPKVICVKVVPKAEPNANGVWRKVVAEARHMDPRKYGDGDKRATMWDALMELVSEDEFVSAVQTDLRFDGKPGNWWPTPNNKEG